MYVRKQSLAAILGVLGALAASSALADTTMATWFTETCADFETGDDGTWKYATTNATSIVSTNEDAVAYFTPKYAPDGTNDVVTFQVNFPYPNDDTGTDNLSTAQTAFRLATASEASGDTAATYKFQVWAKTNDTNTGWVDLAGLTSPTTGTTYYVKLNFTYATTPYFTVSVGTDGTSFTSETGTIGTDSDVTSFTPAGSALTKINNVGFIGEGTLASIKGEGTCVATYAYSGGTKDFVSVDAAGAFAKGNSGMLTLADTTASIDPQTYADFATSTYDVKLNGSSTATTIGVVAVTGQTPSGTDTKAVTIVAAPFVSLDSGSYTVTVSNLFAKASGFQNGDTLNVYTNACDANGNVIGGGYASFVYGSDGKWAGSAGSGLDPNTYALTAGAAIRLETKGTVNFSLVGKTTTEVASKVPANAVGLGVNMTTSDKNVSGIATTGSNSGVYLFVPSSDGTNVQYICKDSGWFKQKRTLAPGSTTKYTVSDEAVTDTDKIKAGTGYWVLNQSDTGATVK